jgi:hypothetical protein
MMTGFEVIATRGFYHPVGHVAFEQGVELISQALLRARRLGLEDMVVNITALRGFEPPGVFERYDMVTKWVKCVRTFLRVAFVTQPEFIDSQKIGMLIAQNRGLSADVFDSEAAALAWLDARLARRDIRPMLARIPPPGN